MTTLDTAPATPYAADILAKLAPIVTDDLTTFLNGAAQMAQPVESAVRATPAEPTAYGPAMNLDDCPDFLLPWLGQLVGVRVTPNVAAGQQRDEIRSVRGFSRGSPDALLTAVKPTLTGTQYARLFERVGGNAAALTLIVRAGEAPNLAQTTSAALAAKAAGRILTVVATSGRTYAEVEADHVAAYSVVEPSFTTYSDAEAHA